MKYYSPFEFETVREFPWPTWSILFIVPFLIIVSNFYEKKFSNALQISDDIARWVSLKPDERPEVLVIGSSLAGMGTSKDTLSERLGVKVGKISLGSLNIRESSNMVRRFSHEFDNVKVVIVEYSLCASIRADERDFIKKRCLYLQPTLDMRRHFDDTTVAECCLPFRCSLKTIVENRKPIPPEAWEPLRKNQKFVDSQKTYTQSIAGSVEKFRAAEKNGIRTVYHTDRINENLIPYAAELVNHCRKNGIHVVFNVYPHEIDYSFPEGGTNLSSSEYKYLAAMAELSKMPGCTTIICSNFNEILPAPRDYNRQPSLTFDNRHMTEEGAVLYSEWLGKQMLVNPAVVAALKTPRKSEDSFVKKYIKKGKRAISKVLPGKKPKTEAVAAPLASGPVR